MKSRKSNFPRSLALLPQIDFFNPEPGAEGSGGSAVNYFDAVNFRLFSESESCNGCLIDYTEVHLESSSTAGSEPIKNLENPEKALLVMGLPKSTDNWTMALKLNSPVASDEVQISKMPGKYGNIRDEKAAEFPFIYEDPDLYFTYEREPGMFETIVNMNQADEVIRLQHTIGSIFDDFSLSFLARSNGAG